MNIPSGFSHESPVRSIGHEQTVSKVELAFFVQTPVAQVLFRHGSKRSSSEKEEISQLHTRPNLYLDMVNRPYDIHHYIDMSQSLADRNIDREVRNFCLCMDLH